MSDKLKKVITVAMLLAIEVILSRFCSYSVWNMKIGFGFVPVAICAMLYGPLYAAILGGLADAVGALLFPIGAYFPGFTVTAAITGAVFGLLLYKHSGFLHTFLAVLSTQLLCGLLINSYWITLLYGSEFLAVFLSRILQVIILTIVQTATILLLDRFVIPRIRKVL